MEDNKIIMELTNIRDSSERFILYRSGEIFTAEYTCTGMECRFECDLTNESVTAFEYSLDDILDGISAYNEAVLANCGSEQRSRLSLSPAGKGRWTVNGKFLNKRTAYRSGISFSFEADYSLGMFIAYK